MGTIKALAISITVSVVLWLVGSALIGELFIRPASDSTDQRVVIRETQVETQRVAVKGAIRSSARCLQKMSQEDGKFTYRVNLNPGVQVSPRYNMLRHAGTMYALARYQQQYPDPEIVQQLTRNAEYLRRAAIAHVPEEGAMLAVWSRPETTGSADPVKAKLGGTGLALLALTSLDDVRPGSASVEELRGLGRFLLFMQKEDGNFFTNYVPSEGGRSEKRKSLFYAGEAILGLVCLYEKDPQEKWLEAATNGMAALARRPSPVAADHWALLAIDRLLPLYDRIPDPSISRTELLAHAERICETMLANRPPISRRFREHGSFSQDGSTGPTATRIEGLLAARDFLPPEKAELREQIDQAARDGVGFLMRAQVAGGSYRGGMPRAIGRLAPAHPYASTEFNERATEVRIDYIQHSMCAFMQYERLLARQVDAAK